MSIELDINIQVKARYLPQQSRPKKNQFAFSYTINIQNNSAETVKLISRHWVITDDNNMIQEVRGEGVVGLQPVIRPGQIFHYTSGAVIATRFGNMQGSYLMISSAGYEFNARIPPFLLSMPHTVH